MVTVDEKAHTYTSRGGERYISATDLIALFKQPIDRKKAAEGYARKHGQTAEHWLNVWDQKRILGEERGHKFHKYKEDYINGRGLMVFKEQITYVQNQDFYEPEELITGLYTEKLLWNDAYKIAGRADIVVVRYPAIVNRYGPRPKIVDLDDHKTNETIHTSSYFNPKTKKQQMMKYPLNHLQDCNFQHYELQQSVYAYMLEQWGYQVGDLQFTHYPHGQEDKPVVYPLQYRKKEVLLMLNHYRKHKKHEA